MTPTDAGPASSGAERAATAFVLLTWFGLLVWSLAYIQAFAPRFPVGDEVSQWVLMPPYGRFSWEAIWLPHNEHRIPIPRLVHWAFYRASGSLLPAMWFQAGVLAAIALGLVAAARRARGRTLWTDVFLPLSWMHVGNCANLLSGFQLALTLPTAIASAVLAAIVVSPRLGVGRAAAIGSCLVALPLCGAVGLVQAPVLAVWAARTGWSGVRSAELGERRGSRILLASVLLCALAFGLHLWRFPIPAQQQFRVSLEMILSMGCRMISLPIGPAAALLWPVSGIYCGLALAATAVLLTRTIRRDHAERVRGLGLAALIAGTLAVVVSIGIGRAHIGAANGFAPRYVTLTVPLLCSVYFAWSVYGSRIGRGVVCGTLAIVAGIALPLNAVVGQRYAKVMKAKTETFERMVERGDSAAQLLRHYCSQFSDFPRKSRTMLQGLCEQGRAPFDRSSNLRASDFDHMMFDRRPTRIESDAAALSRYVEEDFVMLVYSGTAIHFELRPEDRRVLVRFGIAPPLVEQGRAEATIFAMDMVPSAEGGGRLFERELDPLRVEADRGSQSASIELPPHGEGEIVLRSKNASAPAGRSSWSYWFDLRFE